MKVLSLQRAAAYSFIAHILFLIFVLIFSHHIPRFKPTTYTVNLVEKSTKKAPPPKPAPPAKKVEPKAVPEPAKPQNRQKVAPKPPQSENRQKVAPKKPALAPEPAVDIDKLKAQRLQDLQKKKQQEELEKAQQERERKIQESLSRIRQEAEARSAAEQEAASQAEYGRLASEYEIALHEIFYSNWTFPDIMGVYSMSARVLITVYPDGRVDVNKILKPSGNRVFDRSTLKAINDAGRVPPPPYGRTVEIEVEFRPER